MAQTLAAHWGHVEVLKVLIENGGLVTSTALKAAVESGSLECVRELFAWLEKEEGRGFSDRGSRIEIVREALRIASGGWRSTIVDTILKNGGFEKDALNPALVEAVINVREYDDFHVANPVPRQTPEGKSERMKVVRLLLNAGADVNAQEQIPGKYGLEGTTPLHYTAAMGSQTKEIFDLLLNSGADPNAKDEDGGTPLFPAVWADDVYCAQQLIHRHADASHVDKNGCTPLHHSTGNETHACLPIMSLLLSHGASLSARTLQGETPLHQASQNKNVAAVELILSLNPSLVEYKTLEGWTALQFAFDGPNVSTENCIEVSNILRSHGADINAKTPDGYTVLHRAVRSYARGAANSVSFLLRNGVDVNPSTARSNPSDTSLNDESSDPSASPEATIPKNKLIDTPLHLALDESQIDIIRVLLDNGANIESKDARGRTALLRAVTGDIYRPFCPDKVMEVLSRGADVETKDDKGMDFEKSVQSIGWEICRDDMAITGFRKMHS